ncbi:hypothetical protein BCR43DRAFT_467594 [Syncephalastrum racemosum]|uniref:Uncharacterized protein n=1 Tax=Syncephalastrum racemosum TaxID=13706 RepID=A0A1X2HW37_SYNRA|nr:hypothetical protein BCR43DRAFT_467594 [Syncephalastrum racemosum]
MVCRVLTLEPFYYISHISSFSFSFYLHRPHTSHLIPHTGSLKLKRFRGSFYFATGTLFFPLTFLICFHMAHQVGKNVAGMVLKALLGVFFDGAYATADAKWHEGHGDCLYLPQSWNSTFPVADPGGSSERRECSFHDQVRPILPADPHSAWASA